MSRISSRVLALSAAALLAACGGGRQEAAAPAAAGESRLASLQPVGGGVTAAGARVDGRLRNARGKVDVWVSLDAASLASTRAALAAAGMPRVRALSARGEGRVEAAAVRTAMAQQRSTIQAQQNSVASSLKALGAVELARVSVATNAIAVSIDASQLRAIGTLPGVHRVRPVVHYEKHLGETVPYVGGAAVQAAGFDGSGVRVAVLDSGIDYTHRNLSGSGSLADYAIATADPTTIPVGLYPTAKVVGGYDFVGSTWSAAAGTRTEDPNPIDDGPEGGHGTHVADIIAGKSLDGTHKGMAPGAQLLAVKVCSSVSTNCNGIALLKGMDFALDPNGDGNIDDAVDVINMSLGSDYGQPEDDLSFASANAVAAGVIVVASAGNGSDRPYKVGSPSTAPGVISVAQTQTPSAVSIPLVINSPAAIAGTYKNTATLDWAPIIGTTTGDVVFVGRGCIGDAYSGDPAGKVALILRGTCNISEKVDRAARAGAKATLIALVAAGDAQTFSLGNGSLFVPSMVIQQSLSNAIRTQLTGGQTVSVTLSEAAGFSVLGSIVGSSSRGPSNGLQSIKPEIGAPGASVSAEYGTGTGTTAFGGTSGAAPMVAGAAALMVQAHPARTPLQIKAMLMNSADNNIFTSQAFYPGQLAPVTRIGAGELRVNRALGLTAAAWDQTALSAALSFGAVEAAQQQVVKRTLTVQNFGATAKQFRIASSLRYADDNSSGAVKVQAPATVNVPANGSASVDVSLVINPSKLPTWALNGGSNGGNGQLLNGPEYDGYVTLTAGAEVLSVPWHVLPRKASNTSAAYSASRGANLNLVNSGAEAGNFDVFSLTGSSPALPASDFPNPGDNFATIDLRSVGVRYLTAGQCGVAGGCMQWAVNTYQRRSHPAYPGGIEVDVDSNGDGSIDYYVYQAENGGFGASGQSVVAVQNARTGTTSVFFFNIADLNSGNSIFTVPLSALGVSSPSTTLNFEVWAYDSYFTGAYTDAITGMKFTPASPRYALNDGNAISGALARGASGRLPFTVNGVGAGLSTEEGFLLMFGRNAGAESQEIRPVVGP